MSRPTVRAQQPVPSAAADFRHATPAFRTFSGTGALESLGTELERVDRRRAVVICGASMVREGHVLNRVKGILGDRLVERFDEVAEHSPLPSVQRAARLLETQSADAVIAVGGGSAIVTARAAIILHAEKRDVRDLCTQRGPGGRLISPRLLAPKLPIWVVPSTPTTAYAKAGTAVRDPAGGERLAMFDPKTRAQAVILDPAAALTAPVSLTQGSALNAFSMAIESLQASVDPLADALLLHAIRLGAAWLPALTSAPDDAGPRLQLMITALLAGQGSDYVGGGLAQALAHVAGPLSSVPNGVVEVIALPHTLRYNIPARPGRLGPLAAALGESADTDEEAVAAVDAALARWGLPRRLRDVGIVADALPQVAAHTMDDWSLTRVPRRVEYEDVLRLLQAAW